MTDTRRAVARRRARMRRRLRLFAVLLAATTLAGLAAAAVSSLLAPGARDSIPAEASDALSAAADALPPAVHALPSPRVEQARAAEAPCEGAAVVEALRRRDPAALVDAFGGGEPMRLAVVTGAAACVRLDDPGLPWVVVNKLRPLDPVDYAPDETRMPAARAADAELRADAAAAFDRLAAAAEDEGAGRIALVSGYRSYATQVSTYESQVEARGSSADAISARPGHSEHQLGLAADVVACDGSSCGTIDQVGGTAQGRWIAEEAWRFGWIVRYERGQGATTGYDPEPWHLRYVGEELAQAYRAGGFHSLEEFFGLPAAPDYG